MIFKALSSTTRVEMLKLLLKTNYHVSGLAKALNISVPVAAKHVKILEREELVNREIFGKTHILMVNREKLYETLEAFTDDFEVEAQEGSSILEVLKDVAGIEIKRIDDKEFITSINGEDGFYIYEVNGKAPDVPINKYIMEEGVEIGIKRLVPVLKKRVRVAMHR